MAVLTIFKLFKVFPANSRSDHCYSINILNKRVESISSASSDAYSQANKNTTEIQILRVELVNIKEQSSHDIVTLHICFTVTYPQYIQ